MNEQTMLREVHVRDAVGMKLAHDVTRIVPGEFKGPLFRKGHVIREEDISALLDAGKEHVYILNLPQGFLHEDEAAERMAHAICGSNIGMSEPGEGKVTLKAAIPGLLKVDRGFIDAVNAIDEIAMATLKTDTPVETGQSVVGTRVIPLVVREGKIETIEQMARQYRADHGGRNVIEVLPYRSLKVGVITTGSEVLRGRIDDKFGPVLREKLEAYGSVVAEQRFTADVSEHIVGEIRYFQEAGVDMILVTGGMSVDPDDRTPGAIKQAGARIVSHGTPMLPGSMLMMAYLGDLPVLGLPGSVMYHSFTVFDVLLPRILAGDTINRQDITALGYGGLFGDKG